MADAYMGWSLDYAKRMMRLIEPFNLRWLKEAIIPDDINGYHELRRFGTTPIAAGEHEFTSYGFRQDDRGARAGLLPVRHEPGRWDHRGA